MASAGVVLCTALFGQMPLLPLIHFPTVEQHCQLERDLSNLVATPPLYMQEHLKLHILDKNIAA